MSEILREFLLETNENLVLLDSDLIQLEKNPADRATLAQVFRTLHSVKGTAGFMGLAKLQAVAHAAESLLSRLRAGELNFSRPIATALLQVVDAVREMATHIETAGDEGSGDYTALISELDLLRATGGVQAASPLAISPSQPTAAISIDPRSLSTPASQVDMTNLSADPRSLATALQASVTVALDDPIERRNVQDASLSERESLSRPRISFPRVPPRLTRLTSEWAELLKPRFAWMSAYSTS